MNRIIKSLLATMLLSGLMVAKLPAATVDFTDINDTNPLGFFVPDNSTDLDALIDGNIISFIVDDFFLDVAGGDTGDAKVMFDTVSFNITAPEGYFIKSVKYKEGLKTTVDGGVTISHGSLSVNGKGSSLGVFTQPDPGSSNFALGTEILLLGQQMTAAVAITNSITAVAFIDGIANVYKGFNMDGDPQMPSLEVTLSQVPIPAAVWLFGSALIGFVSFSRRRPS